MSTQIHYKKPHLEESELFVDFSSFLLSWTPLLTLLKADLSLGFPFFIPP